MLSTTPPVTAEEPASETRPFLTLALVCVAVTTLYLLAMLAYTKGHFVPQVADLYLIAQYAKGFAEGHPFQYIPGEAPTTGATSLLHTAYLGLAHAVGIRGEGLIAFAILSGAFFMFLTVMLAHRAALAFSAPPRTALLGALLVALNGPLVWSFHYGADISLVLVLSMWLFTAWVEGEDSPGSARSAFVLPACLLAATRPEAAILVGLLGLIALWETRRESGSWGRRALFFVPAGVAVAVLIGLRIATGAASNTSYSQKLLSENWGAFSAAFLSVEYWSDVGRGLLLGFYPPGQRIGLSPGFSPYYSPPLLLVFVFIALLRPAPGKRRAIGFFQAALLTALAITQTVHLGVHFNRYLLFMLPPLMVLLAIGLAEVSGVLATTLGAARSVVQRRTALVALTFALVSVLRFALIYADWASSTYEKDEALMSFIDRNLPKDAVFLNNVTAIEYKTGRRTINLSGVMNPGFAKIRLVESEASSFELLSRLPVANIPQFLIAAEPWVDQSVLRPLLDRPVFMTVSLQPAEFGIFPIRREILGRQREIKRAEVPTDLVQTDTLNVTDPEDEESHAYRFQSAVGTRNAFAALTLDTYQGTGRGAGLELGDGGRVIFGFEEFAIATPGVGDLWMVMRTHPAPAARIQHPEGERRLSLSLPQARMRISTPAGSTPWITTALEPGWNEIVLKIPGGLVTAPRTVLRIEGNWSGFSYWFFRKGR